MNEAEELEFLESEIKEAIRGVKPLLVFRADYVMELRINDKVARTGGDIIRAARELTGFTQSMLSEKLESFYEFNNVQARAPGTRTIQRWESGNSQLGFDDVMRVLNFVGVTMFEAKEYLSNEANS